VNRQLVASALGLELCQDPSEPLAGHALIPLSGGTRSAVLADPMSH
jgi:hypothetical protein